MSGLQHHLYSLHLSLRLHLSLSISTSNSAVVTTTPVASVLVTTPPKPIEEFSFKFGNFSNDILSSMRMNQMRTFLIGARDTLF